MIYSFKTLVIKICNKGRIFYSLTTNCIVMWHQCTETVNSTVNLMIKNRPKQHFLCCNLKMSWILNSNNQVWRGITRYDHIITLWLHSNIVGNNMWLQLSLNLKTVLNYTYVIISNQWGVVAQRELWNLSGDHIKMCCQTFTAPRLLSPCCPVIGTRMRYKLISHKPPSKQLTKLCKLTSSDGLWDNFFCRASLLSPQTALTCTSRISMFTFTPDVPSKHFFFPGPAVSSQGGLSQRSGYG